MRKSAVDVRRGHEPSSLQDLLVERRLLTREELELASRHRHDREISLTRALLDLGLVTPRELARSVSCLTGVPLVELAGRQLSADVVKLVPAPIARQHCVVPLSRDDSRLKLAMADPTDRLALHRARFLTGLPITPVVAAADAIEAVIQRYSGACAPETTARETSRSRSRSRVAELVAAAECSAVAKICTSVVSRLVSGGATAAEIVPRKSRLQIHWRGERERTEASSHAMDVHAGVIAHLKILARLDVDQQWRPQRGIARFAPSEDTSRAPAMLEVITAPTRLGECVTVRVLESS